MTAVYSGNYDETNLKTHAAIQAGKPPAAVIMSANFVREYIINDEIVQLDGLIEKDGQTPDAFIGQFWPALKLNATEQGHVYGVPFQNSTPLLYYSVDAFKDAGLDPDHPPVTWQEWVDAAKKLVKRDGANTTRWGLMVPGPMTTAAGSPRPWRCPTVAQFYNTGYGGEVYYANPAPWGRCGSWTTWCTRSKVMPEGVTDANTVTTAFFQGRTGMMVLSTGSLSFVRDNMKTPYRTAFLPRAWSMRRRSAAPRWSCPRATRRNARPRRGPSPNG